MQTLELNKMGLVPMQTCELQEVDGGNGGVWVWLAKEIIENWDDIKKGAKDGWNSVHYSS